MTDIKQIEQEFNQCKQLVAQCDEQIIRLEAVISHVRERKKYASKTFEKDEDKILEDLNTSLSKYKEELPKLIEDYQRAFAAHEKALAQQK